MDQAVTSPQPTQVPEVPEAPREPTALAVPERRAQPPALSFAASLGLQPKTLPDWLDFCRILVRSGMVPEDKPEALFVRLAVGAEIGLPPMAAMRWVYTFESKGVRRTGVMGYGKLAVVQASGADEWTVPVELTPERAVWQTLRKGQTTPVEQTFTWEDAVRGKLTGKETYQQYPTDMLSSKALGRLMDRVYADVLAGRGVPATGEDEEPDFAYVQAALTDAPAGAPVRPKPATPQPRRAPAPGAPLTDREREARVRDQSARIHTPAPGNPLGALWRDWKLVFGGPEQGSKETEAERAARLAKTCELLGIAPGSLDSWSALPPAQIADLHEKVAILLAEQQEADAAGGPDEHEARAETGAHQGTLPGTATHRTGV